LASSFPALAIDGKFKVLSCRLFQLFDQQIGHDSEDLYDMMVALINLGVVAIFIISFGTTVGTVTWVYSAEILTDKGMSLASCMHWVFYAIISYLPNFGMKIVNKSATSVDFNEAISVFFFMFSGFSLCAFFMVVVFFKESKDLDYKDIQIALTSSLLSNQRHYSPKRKRKH
jgi:preprotein translocase subunit SecY